MNWDVFKKPGVEDKSEPTARPTSWGNGKQVQNTGARQQIDFNSLPDNEKSAFSHAIADWKQAAGNPKAWAKNQAQIMREDPKAMLKAATQLKQDLDSAGNPEEVFRYPWWSAARDWDPNAIGALGQSAANGLKPSQAVIEGVQARF